MEYKIGSEARCAVIGHGSWATALVKQLTHGGQRVGWYVRNGEVLESLRTAGRNPRYLNDTEFDRDRIAPSDELDAVVREAEVIILAVPSAYLKEFLAPLRTPLHEMTMVAEGYFAADCIRHINFRHRVEMPIAEMVYRVLYEGASARRSMKELTTKLI